MENEPQQPARYFITRFFILMALCAVVGAVTGSLVTGILLQQGSFRFSKTFNNGDVNPHVVQLIEEESATIDVVNNVTPSVVSIVVKKTRGEIAQWQANQLPFFRMDAEESVALTQEQSAEFVEISSGTGFFVTADGLVLTNRHVVDEEHVQYVVVTNDGKEYPATLVDTDPFQDLAILKVEGEGFPVAVLGASQQVRIGQTVIAIGNTLSEFRNTVTKGVVSGIDRRVTAATALSAEVIEKAIQTDAAINPGNSGGPLINLLGEVIGINTAVSSEGESVGFAIPIDQAKRVIEDVKTYGRIVRPWLGVRYVLVEPQTERDTQLSYELGALIAAGVQPGQVAVFPGSPAEQAGLKEGDVIIAINDQNLTHTSALSERVAQFHPGDTIKVTYLRNGVIEELALVLSEYAN